MFYSLAKFFLFHFDSFNKKKICSVLKQKNGNKISILVDVGAHHGESIKFFSKNFSIDKILAFEPSERNFKILKKKTQKFQNLSLFKIGLGEKRSYVDFTEHYDSESSTLVKINKKSKYFKKKNFYLDFFNLNEKNMSMTKINIDRLENILNEQKIDIINILKIDTEGYDFNVIKGLGKFITKVNYIYFEHHYHNMLKKDYNFSELSTFMKENNFKKIFKSKMFFRKTFEYIYSNQNQNK